MTKDITITDIIWELLKQKMNITSTMNIEDGDKDKSVINNYLAEEAPTEIAVKENTKMRVFDITDVDWKMAENDIFMSLSWKDLKTGEVNEMENVVRNLISMSSQDKTLKWLNDLFLEHNTNVLFMCTLFHTLSHMEYEEVLPNGPTMAMASLNHSDDRVIGYAIKAFANWNSKRTITLMQTNIPNIPWAKKEWHRVLEYITECGDENNELLDENGWSSERVDTRTSRSA